jgi:uncharacterized coiled-coil protein SlyX
MAQQEIDVGSIAGDGTGDPLRDAFTKINENFTELYSGNVQVTGANVLVYSVAGRTGNVVLTVGDVAQAASKSYVNSAIVANISEVNSVINSLSANITAANAVISDHSSRIITLESNAATQAAAITSLNNTKASISYVDTSIGLALSSNAILANVASVNANVAAANAAILLRANLSGANFTGNITANSIRTADGIRAESYLVAGPSADQGLLIDWGTPAALFFGNTALYPGPAGVKSYQLRLQNHDPQGTGDLIVTADDGDDLSNFITMGITGSQYSNPLFPQSFPHDGYVYVQGGDFDLLSATGNVKIQAGSNVAGPQLILTTGNVVQLGTGVVIKFADGTIQHTAFGGNANIVSINANISAANAAIVSLQSNAAAQALDINSLYTNAATQASSLSTLVANAAIQALSIDSLLSNVSALTSNAAVQSVAIVSLQANISAANLVISGLTSNAATQALELNNLQTNAQSQQNSIIALQGNSASQQIGIDLLNSNVIAANTNISILSSNAATQALQINAINANVAAANLKISALVANAATQALDLDNLYANVNYYLSNVSSSNANIAAANAKIILLDANLGSTSTNVSVLQSNAATQALTIDLLNANVSAKADLSGAIFSGNVQADYLLANANVKIASTVEVGLDSAIDYPGLGGLFIGNVAGYYQVVIQNLNNGPQSSGDFVITADDGNDTTRYLNIGMNSSNFSGNFTVPAGDTGLVESPYDGYLNVIGGNAVVRSDGNIFLGANTAVAGLLKDGDFFVSTGLFVTSTITSNSNIISQGNISANNISVGGQIDFLMGNVAHWNPPVSTISDALNQLAARLYALENP